MKNNVKNLRALCAELYQVVGVLADKAGVFEDDEVQNVLDKVIAAANGEDIPSLDLLPFGG